MKILIMISFVMMLTAAGSAFGQAPVADTDTTSTPIKQGDPTIDALPRGLDYVEDRQRITVEELPDGVKQTLESGTRYGNWKEATVFHDQNKDEYIIEVSKAGNTSTYRFDKDGKPIIQEK